ncbi:hypothetical protein DFH09DRAFT_1400845 [Mycena vulgaris]|nr:hypothetical protein DFH09DRAFT_1400845 [Mycena vulgaris]
MSLLSRCSLLLPLPATFDCAAHTTRPNDIDPLHNMELQEKNVMNLRMEKSNGTSIVLTRTYETARATTAGVGNLDVGKPLEPFFSYTEEENDLLVSSKELAEAVGPLPIFLTQYLAAQRLKTARAEAVDKAKRDKDRAEKEAEKLKASAPIAGTMLMSNPHDISSVICGPVDIPPVWSVSLSQKVRFPLHCWTDAILRGAIETPHSVPKENIRAGQLTALVASERVQVVDVAKATNLYGGEEVSSKLSTSLWRQASRNLLAAWEHLCAKVDLDDPEAPNNTYFSEYNLHVVFFANLKVFDELPQVWYPIERELRLAIFADGLFNEALWSSRVQIGVSTFLQAQAFFSVPSVTASSSHALKRPATGDANTTPPKAPRNGGGSGPRGGGGGGPSCEGSGSEPSQSCLICLGPHPLCDYPSGSTKFLDQKDHFCKADGNGPRAGLRTAGSFRGGQFRAVCILFNIGKECPGNHEPERLHVSSLCGGADHYALARHRNCVRIRDGAFLL